MRIDALFQAFLLGNAMINTNALRIEDIAMPSALQIVKGGFLTKYGTVISQASVAESFVLYLQAKARGEAGDPFGVIPTGPDYFLSTTTVSKTSHPHLDCEVSAADEPYTYTGLVALFALEDHDGAHFDVEEICIPIKRNRLFLFNGGLSAHHTVVRDKKLGDDGVKFLGPFTAKSLAPVWVGTPAPPSGKSGKGAKRERRLRHLEEVDSVEDRYLEVEAGGKVSDQQGFHVENEDVDIMDYRDLEEEDAGVIAIKHPENEELM